MMPVFEAHFGDLVVRFALREGVVFVSRDDLFAAVSNCLTARIRALGMSFLEGGLKLLGDASDRASAVIGDAEIGPAIHFHAAGNLLSALSDLTDVESPDLRESAFRVHAMWRWYIAILPSVDDYFGIPFMGMMQSAQDRLNRLNPPLTVDVEFDSETGMWVGSCDALFLATESDSFDGLRERVFEIAPDLIEANHFPIDPENLRFYFVVRQEAVAQRATH